MSGRTTIKAIIQAIILSGVIISCAVSIAQSEFPRISFVDPYWVSLNSNIPGSGNTTFDDYDYYWPQMDSCGFTHVVTDGDGTSFDTTKSNLYLLNSQTDGMWRYAKGVENDYPVGGVDSYFDQEAMETGENIEDGIDQWVFWMSCDSHSVGIVFNDYFDGWHQFMPRDYWFTFTMKMDGDTSVEDPVAEVHIWEELEQSKGYIGHINGLLWEDLWDISGIPKADRIDTIYSTDFKSPGEYELVELDSIGLIAHDVSSHKQYRTHIEFKWLGTRDLYIDNLNVRDVYNYRLFVAPDSSSNWYNIIQNTLQARHNLAGDHPERNFRFYADEPHVNMYRSFAKVDILSKEKPEVPFNGATGFDPPKRDPAIFAQMIDSDELLFNFYTIKPWTDSASTVSLDTASLQYAWDYLINVDNNKRKGVRYATNAAHTEGRDFWMAIQACSEYHEPTAYWRHRAPTPNELRAEAHLALCYGAKGIMYYLYPSFEMADGWRLSGLVDIDNDYGDPWELNASSRYVPNERWDAAQEINAKIDSLSDILLSLNWQDAFVSHPDAITSHATFVESLYSEEFGTDTSYVEIGEFQHNDGTYYLMLVNRRCLSAEDQDVTVWIDTSLDTTRNICVLQDMYEQKGYTGVDGKFANIPLDPGAGRLFKLTDSLKVSGEIAQSTTWDNDIKVFVKGDITIPDSVTLTIEPGAEIEFTTTDNQHSGEDTTKSELIVYGTLVAKGSSSVGDSILFTSNASSPSVSDWYGIVLRDATSDSSKIEHCQIEYAHKGICYYENSVAIESTYVFGCDYGVFVDSSSTKLSMYGVSCDSCSYGIRIQRGAANLKKCRFNHNDYGVSCYHSRRFYRGVYKYADFDTCEVCSCTYAGIILQDSSPIINYCKIKHNGSIGGAFGIKCLGDSDPILGFNTLTHTGGGSKSGNMSGPPKGPHAQPSKALHCVDTSCPVVNKGPLGPFIKYKRGDNVITHNDYGVRCTKDSWPVLGNYMRPGVNYIHDNTFAHVWKTPPDSGSGQDSVEAINNWWGQNPPDPSKFSGPVDWIPYLTDSTLQKTPELGDRYVSLERQRRGKGPKPNTAGDYNDLGTYYLSLEMYDEAMEAFQYVLDHFFDSIEANYALVHLMRCYKATDCYAQIVPYLENLASDCTNPNLKDLALYISISQLCRNGKYEQALDRCQALLAACDDEEIEKGLRLRVGLLYRYNLNNADAAIAAFQDFVARYPEDELTPIALTELEILGEGIGKPARPGETVTKQTVSVPKDFALYQNYPNPFNAQTRIQYDLPKNARVHLQIYNILGQKVKTLADGFQHAGQHQLFWDGRDSNGIEVASGIYFFRFKAGAYALTRKMVLLR
jgi:tetratricopeptide (TPR) repeat protein